MPRWPTRTTEERFWEKVDQSGDCWMWLASKYPSGYGAFWTDRCHAAHRIAYEYSVGPIPDGLFLDHTCRNRGCVNPAHLRVVTNQQNMQNRGGAQKNSKGGVRGVSWNKSKRKWEVRVEHGDEVYYRTFRTIEEAEAAAIAKRIDP